MKKITLIITSCLFAIAAFAQIPNPGFETWDNMGAYSNPSQWGTLNNTTKLASIYTAEKGTPGSAGAAYLKLTSKTTPAGVVNGVAVSGKLDTTKLPVQPKSGFAYSGKPANLTGSWQHMGGSSPGSVSATLTHWDNMMNMRMTVATASQTLSGMSMSWTSFSIPFVYTGSDTPDSCIIFLQASGASPANNDYLYVDNLAFSGTYTGVENQTSIFNALKVYSSALSENVVIDFTVAKAENVKIQFFDLSGKKVKDVVLGWVNGQTRYSVNTNGLVDGIYFLKLVATDGFEARKVIIQH
jgi:Secretion system C-terminal sorting domain